MERRDFLKSSGAACAAATLTGCAVPQEQLIRFIPEEDLLPGVAVWKPSVCTMCPAGCGLLVRVMEGEAEVVRKGRTGLIQMGLAKKLEGNPHHPVNRGRLCPRGQAGIQVTYHPDRVPGPLKREGEKGSGKFRKIGWDEAMRELLAQLAALRSAGEASSLAFITRPESGARRALIARFLEAFGAPPAIEFELFDRALTRYANAVSFGVAQMPTLDLARADYVISFGADLLGTWNSPVSQAAGFGDMRQGRPGRRGKLVQIEPRLSLTASSADEWIPCRPGTEGLLALGIAHVLLAKGAAMAPESRRASDLLAGWREGLPEHTPARTAQRTGVPAATIERLARELAENPQAAAVIGDAALAHSNALSSALAVNALHALVGLRAGGEGSAMWFTPQAETPFAALRATSGTLHAMKSFAQQIVLSEARAPKVVLLAGANPVYGAPAGVPVREALRRAPFVASFGCFIDETSELADLILPDHAPLESWLGDAPESGATREVASVAAPAVRPLHDTRATPELLLEIAHQLGGEMEKAVPWKSFEEMLREYVRAISGGAVPDDDAWKKVLEHGGWWTAAAPGAPFGAAAGPANDPPPREAKGAKKQRAGRKPASLFSHAPVSVAEAEFEGKASDYPYHFLPFPSQALYDGSLAHLPWLQEMPDPLSTAMWCTWVEINPRTAESLGIRQGDLVEVASPLGKLQAPALITPGVAPDVVAMPVGQGHENFTRYATGRGANPISILAPREEPETGAFAWAATRVRLTRLGESKLILFAGGVSRFPHEQERR